MARELIDAALRGEFNEAQARRLAELGPEVVTLALFAVSQRIAELRHTAASASMPQCRAPEGLGDHVEPGILGIGLRDGQASAVDGDAGSGLRVCPIARRVHEERFSAWCVANGANFADGVDDPAENNCLIADKCGVHHRICGGSGPPAIHC
jgi:hypothetical protein